LLPARAPAFSFSGPIMDWLDRVTWFLVIVLVIAALCFPINRDDP
jgi:hypothetical protein